MAEIQLETKCPTSQFVNDFVKRNTSYTYEAQPGAYSPSLTDKAACSPAAHTVEEIAAEIIEVIRGA
jgi:hypothetical protein